MTWAEAFTEVATLLIGAAAMDHGWPNRKNDDND